MMMIYYHDDDDNVYDDDDSIHDDNVQGCKFSHSDMNPVEGFLLHTICNSLVILKSIFNSVVFALRHNQVTRVVMIVMMKRCR